MTHKIGDYNGVEMSVLEHLIELRYRLFVCVVAFLIGFGVSFYFSDIVFTFLTQPLYDAFGDTSGRRLIYTGLAEKFLTDVRLALFSSFVLVFPFIAVQIWRFIAPALFQGERLLCICIVFFTPAFFIIGLLFVYYCVMPIAWQFFLGFEQLPTTTTLPIQLEAKVSEYLSMTLQLMLAFGVIFELPVLLLLLVKVGTIRIQTLKEKRRWAILIAFVVAAIATPPDPLSQIGLASVIILLYEMSILVASVLMKNKK